MFKLGKKSLVVIRVSRVPAVLLSRRVFCQWSKYLLAPAGYQEQVCPVLEQGTIQIRQSIWVKTCPPVGPGNGLLSCGGSGHIVSAEMRLKCGGD